MGVPQLYFSSSRPGGPGIYVSEQTADGSFGAATLVLELSSLGENSRPSIRHDGREIFITSNHPGSIANSLDLWVATRETVFDAWSEPINLGSTLNNELVDVQPYISSDRETLFFASNRPGNLGVIDLYTSTRTKLPEKCESGIQVGVIDLEAAMSNAAGDPTTTFCLKGRGTRFTGED